MKKIICFVAVMVTALGGAAQAQLFPESRLEGPAGTDGNWAVIDYLQLGEEVTQPVENVVQQVLDIQDGSIEPAIVEMGLFPFIHLSDPDNPGGQGGRLDNNEVEIFPYPGEEEGLDDQDFISVAHARLNVPEAGPYTLSLQSDDGFGFRIFGAEALQVSNAEIDPDDSSTVLFRNNTGNTNSMAVYQLEAGQYSAEYVMWERGGGAYAEIASVSGNAIDNVEQRYQWTPLGDPTVIDERTEIPNAGDAPLVTLIGDATLRVYDLPQEDQPLEFAREAIFDNFDNPLGEREISQLQVSDNPSDPAGCPFGVFNTDGAAEPYPGGTPADDFGSLTLGKLQIDDGDNVADEELNVLIHMDSDDRGYFRIDGEEFVDVAGGELDGDFLDINSGDGIGIYDDSNTCNTDFTGAITLTEGVEYDFEIIQTERGGNAGFQILAGLGEDPFDLTDVEFDVVSTGEIGDPIVFARNVGIGLVAEDPNMTDPTLGPSVAGDYNGNGMRDLEDLDLQAAGIKAGDTSFDLDGDGDADLDDRIFWIENLSNTHIGDSNFDGEFSSSDFVTVFTPAKYETGQMATFAEGDWNGDMVFNSSDFVFAFTGGGYETGPREGGLQVVPEPSAMALVLFGFLGLLGIRRK